MLYAVTGGWWLVLRLGNEGFMRAELYTPDLLTDELSGTGLVDPLAHEQLTQERVEGLLLTTELLVTRSVLLLESAQEPLENEHAALLLVLLRGGSDHDGRHLGPVRRELGERSSRQNEGRGSKRRKVAIERGYRLC